MKKGTLANLFASALVLTPLAIHAQNSIYKANNTTALNSSGSWTNNVLPTINDWALWDTNVAAVANCTNENIGASMSWGGIQILNPAGAITITNSGKTLTLGGLGIDMNEPNTTVDLFENVPLTTSGAQAWNIKPGRTLSFGIGSGSSISVAADLAINGRVRFNAKDFRVGTTGTSTLYLTNDNTFLDFSTGPLSFSVAYGGNCTVNQTTGTVNLFKSSTSTGAMLIGANGASTGTYNLNGGSIVDTNTVNDYLSIGDSSASVGTLNVNGGTVVVPQIQIGNNGYGYVNVTNGSITTAGADMLVNKGGNSLSGSLNVYGGTVSLPGRNLVVGRGGSSVFANSGNVYVTGTGVINVGSSVQIPGAGANPGIVTLDGGSMNVTNNVTFLNAGSSGSGTLNLNGGTFTVNSVAVSSGSGAAVLNFNGGTLRARANNGTFIANSNNLTANILFGGAVIDSAGFNITVPAQLLNGGGQDGGLTKLGAGTLTLSGPAGTYYGASTVNAGMLSLTTTNHTGGAVIVADGAALHVNLDAAGDTLNASSLSWGNNVTQEFDLNGFGNPGVPVIHASNLVLNGAVSLNVFASTNLMPGIIPLVAYDTVSGSATFNLNFAQGVGGYVTNNAETKTIELVASILPTVVWRALVNTNWDTGTLNWVSTVDDSVTIFANGAGTLFDDSTSNSVVNLTGAMSPTSVLVSNNLLSYAFSGPGRITGSTGLTKQGSGTLVLALTNDYTGQTIISNGIVRFGTSNAIPLGSDATLEGELDMAGYNGGVHALNGVAGVLDNSGATPSVLSVGGNGGVFSGSVSNSGASLALSKGGGNLYLLAPNNAYSGGTTNGGGLLQLGSERSIGTGPLTLNGGTLAWSDSLAHTITNLVAAGGGVTFGAGTNSNGLLTIPRTVDFLGTAHGLTCNQDVLFSSGMTNGSLNGKSGPNLLTLKNTVADWNGGSLSVNGGTLVLDNCTVTQDGSNIRIQCSTNATARLVITNGSTLVMAGSPTVNFRFADSTTAGTDATNILDLAGTLLLTPYSGSSLKFQMGSATDPSGQNIANLLPGGLLIVKQISDGCPNSVSTFNFNGGTLRAATNDNAASFMQGLDNAYILDSGATIDTAGYNITIAQSFQPAGTGVGGLSKIGAGNLFLNGNNSYGGLTVINGGGVGGVGSLASQVNVATTGTLLAGSSLTNVGTLTINNNVTFANGSIAAMKVTKINGATSSDAITGVAALHYGGTLVVTTNIDMTDVFADGDVFTLFTASSYSGSFASYNLPALPAGLGWDTSRLSSDGSIRVVIATTPPSFTSVVLSGSNLILSGAGGVASSNYRVLVSTNVALPLNQWTPIATNSFDAGGNFSFTNAVDPSKRALFYNVVRP